MMKTTQKSNRFLSLFRTQKPVTKEKSTADDDLIVIRDASNGKYYYLSLVDTFLYEKYEYMVMYNYEPDDGEHRKPELVIMRTSYADTGEQYFYSIKDNEELNDVFDVFIRRYFDSGAIGKQHNKSSVMFNSPDEIEYYSSLSSNK